MARILRGEIRWADLNPARGSEQAGLRPVIKPRYLQSSLRNGYWCCIDEPVTACWVSTDSGVDQRQAPEALVSENQSGTNPRR